MAENGEVASIKRDFSNSTIIEMNETIECGIEWNRWKDLKSITQMENTENI